MSCPVGRGPVSLSVVDVNSDGNPDALTANIDNNSVSVLATAIGLLGRGGLMVLRLKILMVMQNQI